MESNILKKIRLISRYGFFASGLLNIEAMENASNLKEYCSKNENNLKNENNFNNSFLLQDKIETCKKCNDIKKIKEDLTKILNSMGKIFLEVFNDDKYETMKKLAKDLYFNKKENDVFKNIDKFQMLLNLLDDDLYYIIINHIKYKKLLYNIDTKTISEFKKQFKDDNKIDIVDYLVAEFKKLFTNNYSYTGLSSGCFGLTYYSDKITTLLIKELRKKPTGNASIYNTEEKLKKLKIDEYKNYLEKKDILPGYICQYYINFWSKIVILQMIPGEPYKDFNGSELSDNVENNIKTVFYINNCFNDLKNKINYRLGDRHGNNMLICEHGYPYQIDIDNYSFSKKEGIDYGYFLDLKHLILKNKKGTNFSDLEDEDFEIYEKVSEYYKIYDVDFLHCIINNTYRKSPMFYLFNLINSLVKKNYTYYCDANNNTFIKILKFIYNVNHFKNEINNDKLFTLFSIVYNGNEENYNKNISPLYLTNYKILQNNINGTGNNNKDIKGFVNEMLKRKNNTLDLDHEYIKSLDEYIKSLDKNIKSLYKNISFFFESAYFKNLIKISSKKIDFLDNLMSKFLNNNKKIDDNNYIDNNTYEDINIESKDIKYAIDNSKISFTNKELDNVKEINNLSSLKQFIEKCLYNINFDEFIFEKLNNFKEKLDDISIINKENNSDSDQEEDSEDEENSFDSKQEEKNKNEEEESDIEDEDD